MNRLSALLGLAVLFALGPSPAASQVGSGVFVSAPIALNYIGMGRCTVVLQPFQSMVMADVQVFIIDSTTGDAVPGVGGGFTLEPGVSLNVDVVVPSATPRPYHCRVSQTSGAGDIRMVFREINFNGDLSGELSDGFRLTDPEDQQITGRTQFQPYQVLTPIGPETCDVPGGGPGTLRLIVHSDSPYSVTSILIELSGIDEVSDRVVIRNLVVEGRTPPTNTGDIVSSSASSTLVFDVLGGDLPSAPGSPNLPREISVPVRGTGTVTLNIFCDAGGTGTLTVDEVFVSGWSTVDVPDVMLSVSP